MTLGLAPKQGDLLHTTVGYCESRVAPDSIYAVLHRECFTLFPDEVFADLFTDVGRRSVPPMIVAVVMVLQRIEGERLLVRPLPPRYLDDSVDRPLVAVARQRHRLVALERPRCSHQALSSAAAVPTRGCAESLVLPAQPAPFYLLPPRGW